MTTSASSFLSVRPSSEYHVIRPILVTPAVFLSSLLTGRYTIEIKSLKKRLDYQQLRKFHVAMKVPRTESTGNRVIEPDLVSHKLS